MKVFLSILRIPGMHVDEKKKTQLDGVIDGRDSQKVESIDRKYSEFSTRQVHSFSSVHQFLDDNSCCRSYATPTM